MKNWLDYLNKRFGDSTIFIRTFKEEECCYDIQAQDITIRFSFMNNEDPEVLHDVHFFAGKEYQYGTWMSPFTVDEAYKPKWVDSMKAKLKGGILLNSLFFKPAFVRRLENEWLIIPLSLGWTETVSYIHGKPYKFRLYAQDSYQDWKLKTNIWNFPPEKKLNKIEEIQAFLGLNTYTKTHQFTPILNQ